MPTTNKQLQEWLKRFPDDCTIDVVLAKERHHGYYQGHDIYETELVLPDTKQEDLKWSNSTFDTLEFADLHYEYDNPSATRVKRIILGRSDL
jgi:hypothetical protein